MNRDILGYLTDQDWSLLLGAARQVTFRNGETVLQEGATTRQLFILNKGYVTIEASSHAQGICLGQSGPGELLGEVSFLESAGATASIVAAGNVELQVIDEAEIQSLLDSVPGLAARFYRSLAITLAERLRRTTAKAVEIDQSWVELISGTQGARVGNISERQVPNDLLTELENFHDRLLEVEQQIKEPQLSPDEGRQQVAIACDHLFETFAEQVAADTLMDRGWDDLLAFRDTRQIEAGIGDYIFREVFPLLMRSATIACCHFRGVNYANDDSLGELIRENRPTGDGVLGMAIDAWFLSRPFCQAHRQNRTFLAQKILDFAASQEGTVRVMSLAGGNVEELLTVLQSDQAEIYGTCLDSNREALEFSALKAREVGVSDRITVLYGHLRSLLSGQDRIALPPQQVIYGLDLCDRWEDDRIVALLDWVYERLAPGGMAIFSNLKPEFPDQLLLKHILNWQHHYRTEEDWQDLFRRSRFGQYSVKLVTDLMEWTLFAIARKQP